MLVRRSTLPSLGLSQDRSTNEQAQSELDVLRQKMEAATGKKRQELQAQIEEIRGELELAKTRSDAIHNMAQFVGGAGPPVSA